MECTLFTIFHDVTNHVVDREKQIVDKEHTRSTIRLVKCIIY